MSSTKHRPSAESAESLILWTPPLLQLELLVRRRTSCSFEKLSLGISPGDRVFQLFDCTSLHAIECSSTPASHDTGSCSHWSTTGVASVGDLRPLVK